VSVRDETRGVEGKLAAEQAAMIASRGVADGLVINLRPTEYRL
jgi:hypothetical protein